MIIGILLGCVSFAGWLATARGLRRYMIRTCVPRSKNGTKYSVPEVTLYAMGAAIIWPAVILYAMVAVDLPKRRRYDLKHVQSIERQIHGKELSKSDEEL